MTVLFSGDYAPLELYDKEKVFSNEIIDLFQKSDVSVLNLETPVINDANISSIIKTGPNLKISEKNLKITNFLKNVVFTLANNHIFDYGQKGIEETLFFLKKYNIEYFGAGLTIEEAQKVLYKNVNGKIFSFVSFAENEWASANEIHGGANPMDIIENVKSIREAKQNSDYVFVIIHGGHEYYSLPSPRMVKQYRFYAEQGVTMIIGHHSHVAGTYETYKGVPIFYSLGNFLFPWKGNHAEWYKGLILKVSINKKIDWSLVPVVQSDSGTRVSLMQDIEAKEYLNRIEENSLILQNEKEIKQRFLDFIDSKNKLLNAFNNANFLPDIPKKIIFKTPLRNMFFNARQLSTILNLIRCESHRDIIIELLEKKINNKNN